MSTETKQSVKQDLIDILTDIVDKTEKLYQNMEDLINRKNNADDVYIKQQIEAVHKYVADIELKLKHINTGLTLNTAEETILSIIKEKLKAFQTILSFYSTMDTLNNITDKNIKQTCIEQALSIILDLLNIDDEFDNINDNNQHYADIIEIEKTDNGVIVHTLKGSCIIEGDIKNIKIVLSEGK